MVKKLTRTGNSVALVLDRARVARLKRITAQLDRDFGGVFKRLAE